MTLILLTLHTLIVFALIAIVLLQRSEGGALGIGGGGGGFMSGRGTANALTRTTYGIAALFFATSLTLAIFADQGETDQTIFNEVTGADPNRDPNAEISADDLIRSIGSGTETPATSSQDSGGEVTTTPSDDDDPLSNVVQDRVPTPDTTDEANSPAGEDAEEDEPTSSSQEDDTPAPDPAEEEDDPQ